MIYDYECVRCDRAFEVRKPMAESGTVEICHECGCIADKIITQVNTTKASYVDGTKRFSNLKEQNVLRKEARKATRKMDGTTLEKLMIEESKIK